ncbi:hypothetical protein GGC64_006247 [Mycobacterium sp. OAS707]|nr:hypothetical protein [Mycobacterium sp. OAS707]
MSQPELITAFFLVIVGLFTTAALYLGLVGMLGGLYLVRCQSCRHLTLHSGPARSCPHCQHSAHRALPS